jgi:hypothetical protein
MTENRLESKISVFKLFRKSSYQGLKAAQNSKISKKKQTTTTTKIYTKRRILSEEVSSSMSTEQK